MIVRYIIEFWDEIDKTCHTEGGFTIGTTLGAAVDRIVDYYGKTNVNTVKVYECEDCMCDEEIKDILAEENT